MYMWNDREISNSESFYLVIKNFQCLTVGNVWGGFGMIFDVYVTAFSLIWSYAPVIIYKTFVQNKR